MTTQTPFLAASDRKAMFLATAALGLFSYFSIVLIALHFVRPDYTPIDHMISDYAVGRFGWLMTTAFIALGLGCFFLSLGLWREGPKTISSLVGRVFLIIAFLGLMVTATFPTDLEFAKDTSHGIIHNASFRVNIISIVVAALTISLSLGADARWKNTRLPALLLSFAMVVGFAAQIATLHKGAPYGIVNRVFVAVIMAWLLLMALRLRKSGR